MIDSPNPSPAKPKLLRRYRMAIRTARYRPRTEAAYVAWIRRFVWFHGLRHPGELREGGMVASLTHLATVKRVAASTQTKALSALLFLYKDVLGRPLGDLGAVLRARASSAGAAALQSSQ